MNQIPVPLSGKIQLQSCWEEDGFSGRTPRCFVDVLEITDDYGLLWVTCLLLPEEDVTGEECNELYKQIEASDEEIRACIGSDGYPSQQDIFSLGIGCC